MHPWVPARAAAAGAALLMSSGLQAWTAAIFVFRDPDLLHVAPQGVAMLLGGAFFVLASSFTATPCRKPRAGWP